MFGHRVEDAHALVALLLHPVREGRAGGDELRDEVAGVEVFALPVEPVGAERLFGAGAVRVVGLDHPALPEVRRGLGHVHVDAPRCPRQRNRDEGVGGDLARTRPRHQGEERGERRAEDEDGDVEVERVGPCPLVLVREELLEVHGAALRGEIAEHEDDEETARDGRRADEGARVIVLAFEHAIERDAREHRERRESREDVVVKLRAHHREEREGRDEPQEKEQRFSLLLLLALPHHRLREAERREPDPRKERVADLLRVVAEARVGSVVRIVHMTERAVDHVVEDQLVGERAAVPHEHRDEPRERRDGDDEEAAADLEEDDLAKAPRRAHVREDAHGGEDEARRPLRHRRERAKEPGAEIEEALSPSLAPVREEQAGDENEPEEALEGGFEVRLRRARPARRVSRQRAASEPRACVELVGVPAKPMRTVAV